MGFNLFRTMTFSLFTIQAPPLKLPLPFKIFKSSKVDYKLIKLIEFFKKKEIPVMPLKANMLIEKYKVLEGKELGKKLKEIEEVWVNNSFNISEKEIQKIVSN